ncbi:putative C6 finger domain protein [Aspergillus udagawae]|uniref:C6 finger domain protein n=1 Tax=Aspergillus udagawae TaxID=91492 RepID=A0ABQ1A2A2_9EURO|nr:putative C6 finger domain protein [Aspergillus udagawae]GFF71868.1 putative C6 finger domain protein [Aspergillus udagawae]
MSHQGPPRPFRPIAPRTLSDSLTAGPTAEESKIRRASTACTECQRRRTKCSAHSTGTPCSECALHGRDCIIDEYADKRRKVVRDRVQEELAYYREFVQQLLAAIRHGKRTDVDAIINVIRSGASLEKIHSIVAQSLSHTNDVDGLEITVPGLKVPDGVSVSSSADVKEPDGVSAEASPDAGLSAILNKDS